MDSIPLISLVFQSIPESVIVISLGLTLLGVNVKVLHKRVVLTSLVIAIITYVIRPLFVSLQLRLVFYILCMALLIHLVIRIRLGVAFIASVIGLLLLATTESIMVPFILKAFNLSYNELLDNLFLRTILPWPHLIILIMLIVWLNKKGISLIDLYNSTGVKPKNKLILAIIFSILIEALIIGTINLGLIIKGEDFTQLVTGHGVGLLSLILIGSLSLSYFLIRKLFLITQQEAIISTQEAYLENINSLLTAIRAQRHDFLNHFQVVCALAYEEQYGEITNYLKQLTGEVKEINTFIQVNNPAIGALLRTKLAVAESKNIDFILNIETSLDHLPIKSFELVKILGNLIDNSFDAVSDKSVEPVVEVTFKKLLKVYVFEIRNSGTLIPKEQFVKIFERGFTTKTGEHAGIGLAIVQELVSKYRGEIRVESDEARGTVFTVVIPSE